MSSATPVSDSSGTNSLQGVVCEYENHCAKPALVTCHHCPKRLCLKHILEHNEINIVRTHELSDEINCLTHLLSKLDCQQSLDNARKKLDQWKENLLADIENTFEFYTNEINQ